jgi:hypothetical protein
MWLNVGSHIISDDPGDGGPYSGYTEDAEELEDYGVSLGAYLGKHYAGRDKALNETHLGFMPNVGDSVYMVIEDHSDGDTFSSTAHVFEPMKIFTTHEAATAWTTSPEGERCKDTGYFGGHNAYIIKEVRVK